MASNEHVRIAGPLFDGLAEMYIHDMVKSMEVELAMQAMSYVHENLDKSIKHPTPYYETQINIMQRDGHLVVNDRGVIYGPWLEGVGSRNQTTRFKGYAAFRRAQQRIVDGLAAKIQPFVTLAMAKINGGPKL